MKKEFLSFLLIMGSLMLGLTACSPAAIPMVVKAAATTATPMIPSVPTAPPTLISALTEIPNVTPSPTVTPMPPATAAGNPADPAGWALSGTPDPYNAGYTLYTLTDQQAQFALQPIKEFYDRMYHSDKLLTPDQAKELIDPKSSAWTDPQQGFAVSYQSFAQVGYYPYYEFSIKDPNYYTDWQVSGVKPPGSQFYVLVKFRFEQQGFTVFNQTTHKPVVSTPYWGPRLMVLETAFQNEHWMIVSRHEEDLGTSVTPTPTK
jgi:hypothetical protein